MQQIKPKRYLHQLEHILRNIHKEIEMMDFHHEAFGRFTLSAILVTALTDYPMDHVMKREAESYTFIRF